MELILVNVNDWKCWYRELKPRISWRDLTVWLTLGEVSFKANWVITWHQPWLRSWQEHTPRVQETQRRHRCCSTHLLLWYRPPAAVSCWYSRLWWTWPARWWWSGQLWQGQTCGPARTTSRTRRRSWRWGCRWWTRSRTTESKRRVIKGPIFNIGALPRLDLPVF